MTWDDFKTACFNRSHIPPRFGSGLRSLVYSTLVFFGISGGCTLVAHRRFQRLHCGQTARIDGTVLDVGLPRHTDIAVAQDGLDHDVGRATAAVSYNNSGLSCYGIDLLREQLFMGRVDC